jgi:putative heme iron utilization protein
MDDAAIPRHPQESVVEVIRAFPAERVTELDCNRWEEMLRGLQGLGPLRVLVSNGATTLEVDGEFGGFSTAGEFFNVQTDSLDMHIRWQQLAAVFAVEKPGHMDGMATRSIQFFDHSGAAALKIFVCVRRTAWRGSWVRLPVGVGGHEADGEAEAESADVAALV